MDAARTARRRSRSATGGSSRSARTRRSAGWIGPRTPRHRAPRPDRDARASATPTSTRSRAGLGRLRCDLDGAARARRLPRRDRRLRGGPSRRAVDPSATAGRWRTSRAASPTGPTSTGSSPDRPVYLESRDGHTAWVNRRRSSWPASTPTASTRPTAGSSATPDGRPIGALQEGAPTLVERLLPADDRRRARRGPPARPGRAPRARHHPLAGRDRPARVGEVGLHDAGRARRADRPGRRRAVVGSRARRRADRRARRAARADGDRPVRADERQADAGRRPRELHRRPSSSRISTRPAARPPTAALSLIDPEALRDAVVASSTRSASSRTSTPSASGPSARRSTRSAAARRANGPADTRPHIAHIQVIHPDDIGRVRRARRAANAQPYWASHEPQMDELTIPFLGPERADVAVPVPVAARGRRAAGDGLRLGRLDRRSAARDGGRGHAGRRRAPRRAPPFLPDERLELDDALGGVHDRALPGSTTSRTTSARSRSARRPTSSSSIATCSTAAPAPSARRGSWRRSSTGSPSTRRPRSRADGRRRRHGRMTMSIRRRTTVFRATARGDSLDAPRN